MSKKKRPPVGSRRARNFRPLPRPGQHKSRLSAYRISTSDKAAPYLQDDVLRAMAKRHLELIAGTDPALMATSHFVFDGRDFTIYSLKDILVFTLKGEPLE